MHVMYWTQEQVTNGTKCQDILQILKIICAQLPIKDISSFLQVMSNWFCRVCNKACFCFLQSNNQQEEMRSFWSAVLMKNSGGDLQKDDMIHTSICGPTWQVRFLNKDDMIQCIAINLGDNLLALSTLCTIPASLSTFTLKQLRIFGKGIFSDGVDPQSG